MQPSWKSKFLYKVSSFNSAEYFIFASYDIKETPCSIPNFRSPNSNPLLSNPPSSITEGLLCDIGAILSFPLPEKVGAPA